MTHYDFSGEGWYHIPSPPKQTLRQVSVGRTSVYAVDENSETTVPTHFFVVGIFI